ncbi:hypothetical protein CORC01_06865 [Colletotrichum orchidophilum]|uniref:Uncharacterized protein n=1 Tax=Colletotrichum orchidophilum TaxID=1209926 RepID=A0A1G4B8S3_9PEZI|nr:hypothetical protein CORC01_06865 [Colletotrichum orchidophilum]
MIPAKARVGSLNFIIEDAYYYF